MVDEDGVLGRPGAVYKTGELESPELMRFLQLLPRSQFIGERVRTLSADASLRSVPRTMRPPTNETAITRGLMVVSGVTEVYAHRVSGQSFRYERVFSRLETQSAKFQDWARRHSAELVATMAGPSSPDLVALLGDGFGFGRIGGHGGAQERVQRIPMFIRVPGESGSTRREALRLMDSAPEAARILGLTATAAR